METFMPPVPIYISMKPSHILVLAWAVLDQCSSAHAAQRKLTPTPTAPPPLTTLRAEQPQLLLSGKPGALESRLVSVRVRNVGSSDAKQVQVWLELKGGLAVPLRGPKNLRARGSGVYVSSSRLPGVLYGVPQVATACNTCRN